MRAVILFFKREFCRAHYLIFSVMNRKSQRENFKEMRWLCETRSHQREGGAAYSQRSNWMTLRYEASQMRRQNKDQPVRDLSIKYEAHTVGW